MTYRPVCRILLLVVALLLIDGRRGSAPAGQAPADPNAFTVSARTGHFQPIVSIAADPATPWVVTGSLDRTVRVWDTEKNSEIATLFGNEQGVRAVGITADLILSGGNDGSVRLWNRRSGDFIKAFDTRGDTVYAMAVGRSGNIAVTGHLRGTVRIWDLPGRRLMHTGEWHGDTVHCVAVSIDEQRVFSCSRDETAVLWDVGEKRTVKRMTGRIRTAAFGKDGRTLLCGLADNTLRLKSLDTGWDLRTYEGLPAMVAGLAFSRDDKEVLGVSAAGDICIWDKASGSLKKRHPNRVGDPTAAVLCPEKGRLLMAAGGASPALVIVDIPSGAVAGRIQRQTLPASDLVFSVDGRYLYAGAADSGSLMAWDLAECRYATLHPGHAAGTSAVASSPDGAWVATAGMDGTVGIANTADLGAFRNIAISGTPVTALSFDARGRRFIAGMRDGSLTARAVDTGRPFFTVPVTDQAITAIVPHPGGETVFVASADGGIREIALRSGETLKVLARLKQPVFGLEFSPVENFLFYSDTGHIVRGLGIGTGAYRLYRGHKKAVTAFAVDPAHDLLVTADAIGGLRVFGLTGENLLRILSPYQSHLVGRIAIHPGRPLAACLGTDGRIAIWDVSEGRLLATLSAFAGGQWAMVTPEGVYAASEDGADHLEIIGNSRSGALDRRGGEAIRKLLNRPDLVAQQLAGKEREKMESHRRAFERLLEENGMGWPLGAPGKGEK